MLERPANGARVRFDRDEVLDDGRAVYTVRVWLPDAELAYRVELTDARGDTPVFEAVPADARRPDPWLDKYLHSMARQLARAAWPRKLVQWHSPD